MIVELRIMFGFTKNNIIWFTEKTMFSCLFEGQLGNSWVFDNMFDINFLYQSSW